MIDKKILLENCVDLIDQKLSSIQTAINDYKKDLLSESKSSAGDKHETGRAMLQLEMEKLGQQYQTVLVQKQALQKIDLAPKKTVQVGSLVFANNMYYFLATSIGQVVCKNNKVMVVSASSPIGKVLIGKNKGANLHFNNTSITITAIF